MHRCINESCARAFPRAVNFCPYCGTRQRTAPEAAKPVPQPAPPRAAEPPVERMRYASTQAKPPTPAPQEPAKPQMTPEQIDAALERLKKASGTAQGAARPQPGAAPQNKAAKGPPLREPISVGTWIMVAIALALVWYIAKPSDPAKKLDSRVQHAMELAAGCRLESARLELAELKDAKASALQIKQVQNAIASAGGSCEKQHARAKAWNEAQAAMQSALDSGDYARAAARLSTFARKWGDDDGTRDWDKRIDLKQGERLLNEADACLKQSDRACVEQKLKAADKLKRSELQPRMQLLREGLSRLLESTILEQGAPPGN